MTAFVKMHGLGNDFVVFDARDAALSMTPALARAVADRHFGIGCDTVVVMRPGGAAADVDVQFFNADGWESESCLNATRCVARLLMDERGLARVKLATKGGLLGLQRRRQGPGGGGYRRAAPGLGSGAAGVPGRYDPISRWISAAAPCP